MYRCMLLWKSTEVNQVKQLMHIAILYSMQLQVTLKACKIYHVQKHLNACQVSIWRHGKIWMFQQSGISPTCWWLCCSQLMVLHDMSTDQLRDYCSRMWPFSRHPDIQVHYLPVVSLHAWALPDLTPDSTASNKAWGKKALQNSLTCKIAWLRIVATLKHQNKNSRSVWSKKYGNQNLSLCLPSGKISKVTLVVIKPNQPKEISKGEVRVAKQAIIDSMPGGEPEWVMQVIQIAV